MLRQVSRKFMTVNLTQKRTLISYFNNKKNDKCVECEKKVMCDTCYNRELKMEAVSWIGFIGFFYILLKN